MNLECLIYRMNLNNIEGLISRYIIVFLRLIHYIHLKGTLMYGQGKKNHQIIVREHLISSQTNWTSIYVITISDSESYNGNKMKQETKQNKTKQRTVETLQNLNRKIVKTEVRIFMGLNQLNYVVMFTSVFHMYINTNSHVYKM